MENEMLMRRTILLSKEEVMDIFRRFVSNCVNDVNGADIDYVEVLSDNTVKIVLHEKKEPFANAV